MLSAAQRQPLIDQIRQLPGLLAQLVAELSPEQLTTPYQAGEWTVAQNVHHLADSHINSYIRCKLIATEDTPTLKPYDQDAWADLADATAADIRGSLALLTSLHQRWVMFWEQLPAEAWTYAGYHPQNGTVTLETQLQVYAAHGLGHLEQIKQTLAAQPTPVREDVSA